MTLAERQVSSPTVSLRTLIAGDRSPVIGRTEIGLGLLGEELVDTVVITVGNSHADSYRGRMGSRWCRLGP